MKKKDEKRVMKERKASFVLGILSIVFGLLIPIAGLVLGIVGLSIKKSRKRKRDVTLNVIGIVISVANWLVSYFVFFPVQ